MAAFCAVACCAVALCGASPVVAQSVARGVVRGVVQTDSLWSQSLGLRKALTVYLPPSYATDRARRYPVLVYLHGLTGNERNWVDAGHIDRTLDSLFAAGRPEAIVVMPDGDDGWYTTWNSLADMGVCRADTTRKERAGSYCVPWQHYDDYVARDIVNHVDQRYRTQRGARYRAVGGLSMGGYGAITLALMYPDVFSAAASHSGVLSPGLVGPSPFVPSARLAANEGELKTASLGLWTYLWPAFGRDTIGWAARDPGRMAARLVREPRAGVATPKLRFDCGVDDQYIGQNRDFHETLRTLGVSHEYVEWPGAHTWTYWSTHVAESLDFLLRIVGTP